MSEFKALSEITAKIGSGATPRGGSAAYCKGGVSLIRSQNVLNLSFSRKGLAFINTEQAEKLKGVTVEKNDVLLNITGDSIARCCIVPDNILPARVNQHVSIIRCKDKESAHYVSYYLHNLKPYLLKICGVGGTRNALTKEAVENLQINLFHDHKKRAAVLSALDAKIELNNRINAELEAMAKTLYDYWFVQFDFPDKNGKPYKSSGGKMVYNETLKREIPEGWVAKDLGEIEGNIITGKTPPKKNPEYFDGSIPFITIGDIRGNMHVVSTEETLSDLGADYQKGKYLNKGTICVSCIASPGLVGFATEPSQTNQQINSIECQTEENRYYLYFAIKDFFIASKAKTGNTFPNMNKGDFSSIKMVSPDETHLRKFMQKVEADFELILNNSLQNKQLTQLRDWLLPMLMNGQVTVE